MRKIIRVPLGITRGSNLKDIFMKDGFRSFKDLNILKESKLIRTTFIVRRCNINRKPLYKLTLSLLTNIRARSCVLSILYADIAD